MLSLEKKQEKRKRIAKSTCNLFLEKGYVKITISEIAKVAGIGKGTIYEYFSNKEDIIFELMACLQEEYDEILKEKLAQNITTKEKLISLFDIFLSTDEKVQTQRKIYKEFLSIYINNKTDAMDTYNTKMMEKYKDILRNILKDSIERKEISQISLSFVSSIFATLQGYFIMNEETNMMYEYIDNIFMLFELNQKELI